MSQIQQYKSKNIRSNKITKQLTYKIKDGLYIGTSIQAFKDQQFILFNWIQHVIIFEENYYKFEENLKSFYGQQDDQSSDQNDENIKYLHTNNNIFLENNINTNKRQNNLNKRQQKNFDNSIIKQINKQQTDDIFDLFDFIDSAQNQGSSCLILLNTKQINFINGFGNVFSLLTCYLIQKYKWSLFKSLQYMNSRVKGVQISQVAYQYLTYFQVQLLKENILTYDWKSYQFIEELVLRNTFLNTLKNLGLDQIKKSLSGNVSERTLNQTNRGKSKSKFEKPLKKMKVQPLKSQRKQTQEKQNNDLSQLQSIIKSSKTKVSKNQNKIYINQQLNKIKQYFINEQIQLYSHQQIKIQQKNFTQNQLKIPHEQQRISTSRRRQIKISVKDIITKYKKQKSSKKQGLYFDDCYEFNMKRLNKQKSYYNMTTCIDNNNRNTKNVQDSQISNKITKQTQKIQKSRKDYIDKSLEIKQNSKIYKKDQQIPLLDLNIKQTIQIQSLSNTDRFKQKRSSFLTERQSVYTKQKRNSWFSINQKIKKQHSQNKLLSKQKKQHSLSSSLIKKDLKNIYNQNISAKKTLIKQKQPKQMRINENLIRTQGDQNTKENDTSSNYLPNKKKPQKNKQVITSLMARLKQQSLNLESNKKMKKETSQLVGHFNPSSINLSSKLNKNKWR